MTDDSQAKNSRRAFLKQSAMTGTVSVLVNYLDLAAAPQSAAFHADGHAPTASDDWRREAATTPYRYDGLKKVLGQKIFARDLRAKDLTGWPRQEKRVVILRAHHADRPFLGLQVEKLKAELGIQEIITAVDLDKIKAKPDGFLVSSLMVPVGTLPKHLGQVLALLYFADAESYLDAQAKLIDTQPYVNYGPSSNYSEAKVYGKSRIVRYTDPQGKELFSYAQDGSFAPPWATADAKGSVNARAAYYAGRIVTDLAQNAWQRFQATYETQSVDPMFMEPECGLAWYDPSRKELQLCWGSQSPLDDGEACAKVLEDAPGQRLERVIVHSCYPGGGFGGRDSSEFPLYLALAAVMQPGKAIRIVHSRFDQFQAGLKRHPAAIKLDLAVDHEGIFQAFHADLRLDGGGENNYSFAVQNVSARNASSGYRFPRSWVDAEAYPSAAVPAGSVRGFGSFQSAFAMECLVDEASFKMGIDPIDLRLKNIITDPEAVHTGTIPAFRIHSDKLLHLAKATPLWKHRDTDKAQRSQGDILYGVGVALAVKSYGKNPGDACPATVMIDAQGQLSMQTNSIDMGNGSATTLPLTLVDILGHKADSIQMGVTTAFEALELTSSKPSSQEQYDEAAKNPRWVPNRETSMAASASAYQMRHAAQEAARFLLKHGLWPAALAIWGDAARQLRWDENIIRWQNSCLSIPGFVPLPLKVLAAEAHRRGLITGVMIHCFYRSGWAKAAFTWAGDTQTLPIDALAVRIGKSHKFRAILRDSVQYPPLKNLAKGSDLYTPYAIVLAVEVHKKSGRIQVVAGEGFLDCGQVIQRDIVEGQMQGAFAMGVGQALLEHYPLLEGGPGQGGWNLHRYSVAKAADCALGKLRFHILENQPSEPPKGMAEVVFNPVPAALVNAVAHATGRRFYQLPLQPENIKESLS